MLETGDFWAPVECADLTGGLAYDGGDWRVFAEMVNHGDGLGFPESFRRRSLCLGCLVEAARKVIAISGDALAGVGLDHFARDADVLVQCCYMARAEITTTSLELLARETIARSYAVGMISRRARVKKLVLTHFCSMSESMMAMFAEEVARDYDGQGAHEGRPYRGCQPSWRQFALRAGLGACSFHLQPSTNNLVSNFPISH